MGWDRTNETHTRREPLPEALEPLIVRHDAREPNRVRPVVAQSMNTPTSALLSNHTLELKTQISELGHRSSVNVPFMDDSIKVRQVADLLPRGDSADAECVVELGLELLEHARVCF